MVEHRWRALVRKTMPDQVLWLHVPGMRPTTLKLLEQGRGEDLCRARLKEAMPLVDSNTREVYGMTIDDDGANDRCELLEDLASPSPDGDGKPAKCIFKCTVHKHALIRHIMPLANKLDSRLIRFALSVHKEPNGTVLLVKEYRTLIVEQFEWIADG